MTGITPTQYHALKTNRLDMMWAKYRDATTHDLLAAIRHSQQAGRYLLAGDLAAIRATLQPGQQVRDLGKPKLRRILEDRFEWVVNEQRAKAQ